MATIQLNIPTTPAVNIDILTAKLSQYAAVLVKTMSRKEIAQTPVNKNWRTASIPSHIEAMTLTSKPTTDVDYKQAFAEALKEKYC